MQRQKKDPFSRKGNGSGMVRVTDVNIRGETHKTGEREANRRPCFSPVFGEAPYAQTVVVCGESFHAKLTTTKEKPVHSARETAETTILKRESSLATEGLEYLLDRGKGRAPCEKMTRT